MLFIIIIFITIISSLSCFRIDKDSLYDLSHVLCIVDSNKKLPGYTSNYPSTRGYQKVLSLTWKEPEIWIYSALFFNVVPFQLHTLVPSSYPVINTRSVEVNILVP